MPESAVMTGTISKDTMRGLLEVLAKDRTLVGPVDTGKVVEYAESTPADILMDDRVSYKSIKEYYFPQVERMMTFADGDATENTDLPGVIVFGAKPCDLEALRVMKAVFLEGRYADPFFQRHFENNLLIGVGCLEEKPGCFCGELGLDKSFSDFCDILLQDQGDAYTVVHLSDKGREALSAHPGTKGIDCDNSRTAQPPEAGSLALDAELDDAAYFDIIDWQKATETCQGCGMCTFICPTCHCFEFKDVSKNGKVNRYKCWDSCMYPRFTLHASGHNPRAARHERYRQRLLHKYVYVKGNTGLTACTGCGRCIRSCPVGMNIRQVAHQIMEVLP